MKIRRLIAVGILMPAIVFVTYWLPGFVGQVDEPASSQPIFQGDESVADERHQLNRPSDGQTYRSKPVISTTATAPVTDRAEVERTTVVEQFEGLLNSAASQGGPDLVRAFDLHDSCAGVPGNDDALDAWIYENVAVPDVDVNRMRQRVEDCLGMPRLSFDTRRAILQPLAREGDPHAQYLLASLHPYGTRSHVEWLRKAADGGHAEAMVMLAQELISRGPLRYGRAQAYRLLSQAANLGHDSASQELARLELRLTSDELRLALSDEPIPDALEEPPGEG